MAVSGDTLFTIGNGNQSLIGVAMSSATSGTVTDYTLPFATGSCVAAASGVVAVGGYNFVTLASGSPGIQGLAVSVDGVLAIGDAGTVSFWPQSGASWAYGTSVSGLGTASNLAWNEAGSQVLLAGGGDVYVIGYSAGVATLAQTIAIADASNIAVSGSVAIVSQNASGTVTILNESGSTWASGQVITGLTGCEQAIFTSASGAFVAYASGVAELTYGGGTWSLSSSPISGVAAQGVAFDRNGNPYATFNNGASGGFIAYTGATATWAGAASGICCVQDQFVVADPANGLLRLIGPNSTGGYQQYGTETAPASGASTIAYGAAILAGGQSAVDQYYWGHPWSLHRERSGALSVFANGAFSSPVSLGVGVTPTCAAIDVSGNAWFGAGNNDVYEVSSVGALTQTIPVAVYPGQISGTTLGMSSLAWVNNHLYATTSLSGVLIEVI
ncbi:MAG: hypothetical protein PHZ23_14820 [Acidiphilium sp.]|nr:hypothetical protein [Acidiphilium sp.]